MSTADATAAAPAAPMSFREVLRIEVMRRVWYAQVISLFGDFLALFAVIVVVSFAMHGTPNQITGVQIAYMLPIVFVGPIAGVFVDRWPLKPTLVASDLIRAGLAVLLIPSTAVWHVYLVLAALSCVSAFFGPAQQVTIRTTVPAHGLVSDGSYALHMRTLFLRNVATFDPPRLSKGKVELAFQVPAVRSGYAMTTPEGTVPAAGHAAAGAGRIEEVERNPMVEDQGSKSRSCWAEG